MEQTVHMRLFSEADVRRLLPMQDCIEAMRQAFKAYADGKAKNQPRRRLMLESGAVLHQMAGAYGSYFGTKIYSTHPRHGAWFTFLLFDSQTGHPLAQMEANWLGRIRTGAVTGLAASLLTPHRPLHVGVIGSGFQALGQLEALAAVRKLGSVRVWSRRPENRIAFAEQARDLVGVAVEEASSGDGAASGVDALVTATYAKEPVINAGAVRPGTVVFAVGSNNPTRRELPAELVRSALVVVDDAEACRIEAGDLLLALDDDGWKRIVELKHLQPAVVEQPVIFKSVGLGFEDVAAAALVYERGSA
jgi:ornithine cyclodeaminase